MSRTEDDLRAIYIDQPGIEDVERRLLDSIADPYIRTSVRRTSVPMTSGRRTSIATWTAAGASAAAVAAVTVAVAVVPRLQSHLSHEPVAGHRPSVAVSTAAAAVAPLVPVTPQVAVRTLISLLPRAGTTTGLSGSSSPGSVGGTLVYNDGHGAAELAVGVAFPYTSDKGPQRLAAGSLCSSQGVVQLKQPCRTLPDGSQVALYQGDANVAGGAKDWEVSLLRTDGVQVDITEWNSPTEKGGEQTRTDPPFTPAELTAIARSSTWQARVDSAVARRAAHLFVPTVAP